MHPPDRLCCPQHPHWVLLCQAEPIWGHPQAFWHLVPQLSVRTNDAHTWALPSPEPGRGSTSSSAACLFPFPDELPASRVQEKATHGFPQAGWVFRERTHGSEGAGSMEGELQRQGSKVHSSRKAPWPRSSGLAKKKNLLLKKTGGKKSLSSLGVRNNLPFDFVRLLQAPAGHGACLCVSAAVGFQTR